MLLDEDADVLAKDRNGASALGLATSYADVRVVLFLVENGSDLNEFRSGIFAAVSHTRHHLPTTEYLMWRGAKMDAARLTLAVGPRSSSATKSFWPKVLRAGLQIM